MSDQLQGKRIAILVANEGVEEAELTRPRDALHEAGADVDLLAPEHDEIQAFNHLDKGDTFNPDKAVGEADPDDYDGLVLPGGVANPDQLRTDDAAVRLVKAIADAGHPVAAICHGPWTLIETGLTKGKRMTSWPSLQTDLRNAGAEWVDEEVVVDGKLVTSRKPDDLPAFNQALVDLFAT